MNKPRVLIVDDEADIVEVLKLFLEDTFTCETCTDGKIALNKIKTCDYEVLITDLEMPGMPGIELITKAKKLKSKLQIFISTGYSIDHPLVIEALEIGIANIIQKPNVCPETLISIILDHLKLRHD